MSVLPLRRRPLPAEPVRARGPERLLAKIPAWFLVETMITTFAVGSLLLDLKRQARLGRRAASRP